MSSLYIHVKIPNIIAEIKKADEILKEMRKQKHAKYHEVLNTRNKLNNDEINELPVENTLHEDFEVVSVKNDAMFIAGRDLVSIVFPPFEFKVKNVYTVYLQAADHREVGKVK